MQLARLLRERVNLGPAVIAPRTSLGICTSVHRPAAAFEVRLHAADEAMYAAKQLGTH